MNEWITEWDQNYQNAMDMIELVEAEIASYLELEKYDVINLEIQLRRIQRHYALAHTYLNNAQLQIKHPGKESLFESTKWKDFDKKYKDFMKSKEPKNGTRNNTEND